MQSVPKVYPTWALVAVVAFRAWHKISNLTYAVSTSVEGSNPTLSVVVAAYEHVGKTIQRCGIPPDTVVMLAGSMAGRFQRILEWARSTCTPGQSSGTVRPLL